MTSASKLLERMKKWQLTPNGVSVLQHRSEEDSWWLPHMEAMAWLNELEADLIEVGRQGQQVELLMPVVRTVRSAILCVSWRMDDAPTTGRRHLDDKDLAILTGAVGMVNATRPDLQTAIGLGQLLPYVDEARDLVNELTDLEGEVRDYLLELVNRLDQALRGVGVRGESDVRRWASELIGSLAIYASDGDEEQRNKVSKFMNGFGSQLKTFLLRDLPLAVASGVAGSVAQGALPPGN